MKDPFMKVPFLDLTLQHRPLREEILAAWATTLDGNRFCLGRDVEDFEKAFGAVCGAADSVGLDNGTSALQLAAMAMGLGPGDDIVVPAFTFIASAWTATYIGARPVFADIDPVHFCVTAETIRAALTPRTKAVVVVHLFGQPAPMDQILALAAERGLKVIEDCAQAHLASYRRQPVGMMGDAGTFSFYPTKNLGACGEGGAVISRHPELLKRIRALRVHGSERRYYHDYVGGNFRMEGLQAAALSVKLKHLTRWTARRREIAARYRAGLRLAGLFVPPVQEWGESVYHQFTVTHPMREALRDHLSAAEVATDIIYPMPLHLQPCYAGLGYGKGSVPQAERICDACLSLPMYPELDDAQVDHVIAAMNSFPG
jgi:dTDP-4-amino-4,6-dideoxygalactose transaminase